MTFSLHQGGIIMSSQITHTQSSNIHPLAHILETLELIFSSCASLSVYQNRIMFIKTNLFPGDNHQSTGGRSERTPGQANMAV